MTHTMFYFIIFTRAATPRSRLVLKYVQVDSSRDLKRSAYAKCARRAVNPFYTRLWGVLMAFLMALRLSGVSRSHDISWGRLIKGLYTRLISRAHLLSL